MVHDGVYVADVDCVMCKGSIMSIGIYSNEYGSHGIYLERTTPSLLGWSGKN